MTLAHLRFFLKYVGVGFLAIGLIINEKILIGLGLLCLAVFFMIKGDKNR